MPATSATASAAPTPTTTTTASPLQTCTGPDCSADLRLSEIVAALSTSLDITEGQPAGHAVKTCLIGMRLAKEIGSESIDRSALFYALLLKDLGCSSNAAKMSNLFGADDIITKRNFKWVDSKRLWDRVTYIARHVAPDGSPLTKAAKLLRLGAGGTKIARQVIQTRCERGASIAKLFGLSDATADAIRALDEHFDGRGHPLGLKGEQIPMLGRILCLAQTAEVFHARDGLDATIRMAKQRSGSWFDPQLVHALAATQHDQNFWSTLEGDQWRTQLAQHEPTDQLIIADDPMIDRLCYGFAQVVDAKSPWTRKHSEGVSLIAEGIGRELHLPIQQLHELRRVGLLHDIGKLGVSNLILDKQGPLTDSQLQQMRLHPTYSREILSHVPALNRLATLAGSHHEKLNGSGYDRGITGENLTTPERILATADMFEAMSANRPYRPTMSREKVLAILEKEAGTAVCPQALEGLKSFLIKHGYQPAPAPEALDH